LEDCFELFTKPEILAESEAWYCPKCKKHQQASKELGLWKAPEYLVLHLKRFSVNGMSRDKLTNLVNFPLKGLDLTKFISDSIGQPIYDLFAVSNHFGSLGGGHYTAHALVGEQWYEFDDNTTSKVSEDRIVDSSAYVLFYRKRSDTPSAILNNNDTKETHEITDNDMDTKETDNTKENTTTTDQPEDQDISNSDD